MRSLSLFLFRRNNKHAALSFTGGCSSSDPVAFQASSREIQSHSWGLEHRGKKPPHLPERTGMWGDRGPQAGPQHGKEAFSDLPAQPPSCRLNTHSQVAPQDQQKAQQPSHARARVDKLLLQVLQCVCVCVRHVCKGFAWRPRADVQEWQCQSCPLPSRPSDRPDLTQQEAGGVSALLPDSPPHA